MLCQQTWSNVVMTLRVVKPSGRKQDRDQMAQNIIMGIFDRNESTERWSLGATLIIAVALVLLMSVVFAESTGDAFAAQVEFNPNRALRAGANPSMDVAQWYGPAAAAVAASPNRALRAGANPSMDVALWYAPPAADTQDQLCAAGFALCP